MEFENGPHAFDLAWTLKMDGMKTLRYQLPQDWVLQRNRTNGDRPRVVGRHVEPRYWSEPGRSGGARTRRQESPCRSGW